MPFDNTPTEITIDTPASWILEAAIKMIEIPEHWCRGVAWAVLPGGGVAYCAWGAVRASSGGERMGFLQAQAALSAAEKALNAAAKRHYHRDISALNDDARTTHAMVLEVMREAAEIARAL